MNVPSAEGYSSPWMDAELAMFRETASRFIEAEMVPNEDEWRKQQNVGKEIWRKAGAMGLLCTDVSADYGGMGGDGGRLSPRGRGV
jgi:acyl-CoA dehydrogenase